MRVSYTTVDGCSMMFLSVSVSKKHHTTVLVRQGETVYMRGWGFGCQCISLFSFFRLDTSNIKLKS